MNKLNDLITEFDGIVSQQNKSNERISKSTVGWQIKHSLLTLERVIDSIHQSNPSDYSWSFNLPRMVILGLGKIPRGGAKAPKIVQPKD